MTERMNLNIYKSLLSNTVINISSSNVTNTCTILIQALVVLETVCKGVDGNYALSAQFFYKSKTALKNKVY